jgi:hypothetical protein
MAASSSHYGDVQKWVEKVIDSCQTYDHTRSTKFLVWNFEKQMVRNKVDSSILYSIGGHLRDLISYKTQEIQGKYLESNK